MTAPARYCTCGRAVLTAAGTCGRWECPANRSANSASPEGGPIQTLEDPKTPLLGGEGESARSLRIPVEFDEAMPPGDMSARSLPGYDASTGASGSAEPSATLTVETAAVRTGEAVFTLPRPNRHHNVMRWLHVLGIGSGQMHDQGFVLSNGQFADRHVASVVAQEAGQAWDMTVPGTLFSEDLWDGGADLPSMEAIKALCAPSPHHAQPVVGEAVNGELLAAAKDLRLVLRLAALKYGFDISDSAAMEQAGVAIARADALIPSPPEGGGDDRSSSSESAPTLQAGRASETEGH